MKSRLVIISAWAIFSAVIFAVTLEKMGRFNLTWLADNGGRPGYPVGFGIWREGRIVPTRPFVIAITNI